MTHPPEELQFVIYATLDRGGSQRLVPQQLLSAILILQNWLIPARMAHSRENGSFDFFYFLKTLYLHQKHIFCKSGDDKLLGLVCFIIWSHKIFFTTLCFFKSFVLVEIWKMSFSCGNPWIPQSNAKNREIGFSLEI